jgi:N-acetylneuraminate synthase
MNFDFNKLKKNNIPYIIAEIGVNHECSMKMAKKLILLSKIGGAQAVKFQTYKADKIVKVKSKAYWDLKKEKTRTQYELFSKLDKFEEEEYKKLSQFSKKNKIDFLSTPFDLDSVKFLNPLVPLFKISSSDINNIPLIRAIASTQKPVLLSTGASNIDEIKKAVKILSKKTKKIVIMHCVLNYPTKDNDANLGMISDLKKKFPNYLHGYSDHTLPDPNMINLTTAYLLGAKVIEKHFTNNKKLKGNDHYHSMDINDLKLFTKNIATINKLIGRNKIKKALKSELKSRKFARRSIVVKKNINKNQIIKSNDIIALRPNIGISVEKWDEVVGKRAIRNLKKDHTLSMKDLF